MPKVAIAETFGMCKPHGMDTSHPYRIQGEKIAALRKGLALSQEAFAARVGLASKGHVCNLEAGKVRPSVRVALEVEKLSEGQLCAAELNPDIALVAQHLAANENARPSSQDAAA